MQNVNVLDPRLWRNRLKFRNPQLIVSVFAVCFAKGLSPCIAK